MDNEPCACGHVYDEHEDGAECAIEGCLCVYFDYDDEDDSRRGVG